MVNGQCTLHIEKNFRDEDVTIIVWREFESTSWTMDAKEEVHLPKELLAGRATMDTFPYPQSEQKR